MVRETSLSPEPHRPRANGTKGRSCPLEPRPFHGDQTGLSDPLETHDQPYAVWMRRVAFFGLTDLQFIIAKVAAVSSICVGVI
jgi:hypothetical protein